MKKLLVIIFTLCFIQGLKAQTSIEVSGIVKDSSDNPIIGAAVKIATLKDTISTLTNPDGVFVFPNVKAAEFSITITALGFQPVKKRYLFDANSKRQVLDPIILKNDSKMLNEVVVNGTPDVTIKEDTTEYRASAYKLRENALAEDLLKKLPGMEVDRDGNVTAQGKAITKVRINGKDYFGGDVKTATQNLPADVIEKVQVVDDYGDQANITGVRDGEPDKVLNFTIRKDKNKGYLVRGIVGGGNEGRYQGSVYAQTFDNSQQLSFLGNFNNTNANIFSLTSNSSGRGGRGGGGFFGGNNNDGLTNVNSIGFNYRDEWSKKVTAYGSYSFFYRDNNTISSKLQTNLAAGNSIFNNNFSNTGNSGANHRFNFNIEYKIDSLNYLKIIPNVTFSNSDGLTNTQFDISSLKSTSKGTSANNSKGKSPNYGAEVLYNHRFGAAARNLTLNAVFNSSSNNQDQDYIYLSTNNTSSGQFDRYQRQLIYNDNKNDNVNLRVSYTEPISRTNNLEFNYAYGFARADNNRKVFNTLSSSADPAFDGILSNKYVFDYITNRFGANYRVNQKSYNYSVGLAVQPAVLTGPVTGDRSFTNIFPTAKFAYKFSRTREINISYSGNTNQPSYDQLQPVTDRSNAQFYVTGNPNLNPEFTNRLNIRYNNFDMASGNVIFTNLSYSFTRDQVVSNVVNYPISSDSTVLRETRYLNANGFYTLNGFYAFSKPFSDKKYVIGLRGLATYNNNISFIDGAKNTGKNLILSQRLSLQINPQPWLELTPAGNYTYNSNKNSITSRGNANTEVNSYSLSFDSKIYFLKTWIWGTTTDKTINNGYGSIGVNPLILNTYLEKQFFKGKKGSLKLQAFDLLNQSTGLSFTSTGYNQTLSQSNRLARYFMLSFILNISKFAGNSTTPSDFGGERRMYRIGGGNN
ncbi:TonB-dependent receptor family protein [Pelobium sp.]|nr:TonB-dependent receptor [Pelobium sp.]MDA9554796.1 TonB-dependent receptor family protein [Pelobium sp.]